MKTMTVEIAEAIKSVNIIELAEKTQYAPSMLTEDERLVYAELDNHFKKIGETGSDAQREIATFIQKVVVDNYVNAPMEILDMIFDRGTVGEFDDVYITKTPKNTLQAYEAAKGGNVPRSFLDFSPLESTTKHIQAETDITYAELRKNGWKSVATLTNYILEALNNKMFSIVFSAVSSGIKSGAENYIAETNTTLTQTTMDAAALYTNDRANGDGVCVALSKYIQQASKLPNFVSQEMMNEIHKTGVLGSYDGVALKGISSANKLADGSTQFPDKTMLFIAGKIGELDMRGDVRVYETMDNNDEKVHIKVTGFEFTYAFNNSSLENVLKVVLTK